VAEGERERALAFLRTLDRERAERIQGLHSGGLAVFSDSLPLVHDQNKALAPPGVALRELPDLIEEVERVQRAGGLRHRKIAFDEEAACSTFADWFQRRGWRKRPLRLMVHRGPAPGPDAAGAGANRAVEVDPPELAPAAYAFALEEPWGRSPEARRQVVAGDELTARVVAERGFAIRDGDSIVAYCRLYSRDAVGQIENVTTLSAHRRRGYARALVALALRESLAANALTFLVAEGADWPRHFYARMGFEDVGGYCEFNRLGA
jgi:ribosomal protein S18 acetylase RimI-like enzyme